MYKAIVIVAYNRPIELRRLLNSIEASHIDTCIDLVVSIDHSQFQHQMKEVVDQFKWSYGEKRLYLRLKI